jgi:hypothetical protein
MSIIRKCFFGVIPAGSIVLCVALVQPRESAMANILLSAPLSFVYAWCAVGVLVAAASGRSLAVRMVWSLTIAMPAYILLTRVG